MGDDAKSAWGDAAEKAAVARLAARRDRLIEEGRADEAWNLVGDAVARLSPGARLDHFLYDSMALSARYFGQDVAERWMAAYRERAKAEDGLDERRRELLEALELALELARKDYPQARRREESIDWPVISDTPWVVNLRLYCALVRGDLQAALAVLRQSTAPFRRPFDLGNRLKILSEFYVPLGYPERHRRFCCSALRHFRKDGSLRSRLAELEMRGDLGRLHFNNGQFREASEEFESILEDGKNRRFRWFVNTYAVELAASYANLGKYARAKELLVSLCRERPRTAAESLEQSRVYQALAEIALEEGKLSEAREHLSCAQNLLDRFPHARRQAYVLATRGKLEASEGREQARLRALSYLDRAEAAFRELGARGLHGLSKTLVIRGQVHLTRKEIPQALECCVKSMELARQCRFFPLQARALLLKSYLLVEADLPAADSVYEEVLRDLGLVHNPVVLFRVIANLYMYSWNLDDGLELSVNHLDQLHKFREVLDEDLYSELFGRYVTRRVMRRWLDSMGGD